ncbi:MAG: hypothetical protein ABIR47_15175 [Candidatus Kapaibacterium sp.]
MKLVFVRKRKRARSTLAFQIAGLMLLAAMVVTRASAQGTGTAAGTEVTNQATVTYSAGTDSRSASSNTTTFYVAHKVVFNWTPSTSPNRTATSVDSVTRYYAFTVINSGNRADSFLLSTSDLAGVPGGTWTSQIVGTGDDNAVTSSGAIAAGASFSGRLKVGIPTRQTDGTIKTITLTATSTAVDDTVNHIVVANPGASSNFTTRITIAKPVVVFSAVQNPSSPTNGQRIPGQDVTYTMTLQNTGTAPLSVDATVSFVLDPNYRYVSSTSSGSNAGADGNGNGGTVTWTINRDSMAVGASPLTRNVVLKIQQVTNNATGPAAGTAMTAMTTGSSTETQIQYADGDNTYMQDNANSFNFNVGTASGGLLTQVTANQGGNPGDTIEYQYTIGNTGNHLDTFNLSQVQHAGDLNVAHAFSLSSLGSAVTSVSMAAGATPTLYVRVIVPATAIDGQTIIRTLTATTGTASPTAPTGGSTSSSDDVTTTTTAPQVSVALAGASSDVISQPTGYSAVTAVIPGTVVRYTVTITNAGTGTARNISASNVNAHLTSNTLVANSVDIDADGDGTYELSGLGNGYSSGTVGVSIDGGTGFITVTFSSIPSSTYRKYRYNVAVQ